MDCHSLLQGIFPTQGSSLHLLPWQVGSLPLNHQGRLSRSQKRSKWASLPVQEEEREHHVLAGEELSLTRRYTAEMVKDRSRIHITKLLNTGFSPVQGWCRGIRKGLNISFWWEGQTCELPAWAHPRTSLQEQQHHHQWNSPGDGDSQHLCPPVP